LGFKTLPPPYIGVNDLQGEDNECYISSGLEGRVRSQLDMKDENSVMVKVVLKLSLCVPCKHRYSYTHSLPRHLAQAIFEPNFFPYKYPNILNPSHSSYLPAYEDGTECSETSAYKIETPGNYPK